MIKTEHIETYGWEAAIRGMRNPMNSWDKSDSTMCRRDGVDCYTEPYNKCPQNGEWDEDLFCIGRNDMDLMQRLTKAGVEHRKFARMIQVSMDITAPLYWWKEFDTYKVGTVANSCSTMHKIHAKEFELDDFSHEYLDEEFTVYEDPLDIVYFTGTEKVLIKTIRCLNYLRERFLLTNDKKYWWQMIQLLPSSYNQKRTIMMSYEVCMKMIKERSNHKLDEWKDFTAMLKSLPYMEEIINERKM